MAHQTHNIYWDALASNLRYYAPPVINGGRDCTNLHFRRKPFQSKELGYFVESFARNIEECTQCERRKYPASYEPPNHDDIILNDDVVKKITPTVFRWRVDCRLPRMTSMRSAWVGRLCQHTNGFNCGCPIPIEERKVSSFFRKDALEHHCSDLFTVNLTKFFNIELAKTLLLYGEMDPILRVCSHPGCEYAPWQERSQQCELVS